MQVRYDSFAIHNTNADNESKKHSKLFTKTQPNNKLLSLIVEGDALVTKNPCSHPGDVRKVTAINREEFHHLYNVVVFSTKGQRPDQNKLSMGDLDGDTYLVIWDKDLVSAFGPNHEPSNNEKVEGRDFKSDDPVEHILNYLKKDNLGKLCNMHQALCDRLSTQKRDDG